MITAPAVAAAAAAAAATGDQPFLVTSFESLDLM